jgi:Arc/MetJ family transcription regulator
LPLAGVAAAVETGDDQERLGLDEKKECVGKFLRARTAESFKDHRELPRIVGHAFHHAVDFGAETMA